MGKVLAFSILIVPLLIARRAAGMRDPRRGLRRTVVLTVVFSGVYVLAILFLYFRLL